MSQQILPIATKEILLQWISAQRSLMIPFGSHMPVRKGLFNALANELPVVQAEEPVCSPACTNEDKAVLPQFLKMHAAQQGLKEPAGWVFVHHFSRTSIDGSALAPL